MDKKVLFTILRYISLVLSLWSSVFLMVSGKSIDICFIALSLIFIINNQIRFFSIPKRNIYFSASILAEAALALIIFQYYGGIIFLLLFSILLDSTIYINNKYITGGLVSLIIIILVVAGQTDFKLQVSSVLSSAAIGALGIYIKEERERKHEAQKLYDKLRISEEELKKAKENLERYASTIEELTLLRERNRISREIHDSVGHSLSTMIIQLSAIEKIADSDGKSASEMAKNLSAFAKDALKSVRAAVRALVPTEFEKYQGILAIEEMIKNFKKLTEVEVIFVLSKERWELNSDQSFVLYRIVQEFLTNSVRHGKADKININLNFYKDSLYMRLKDNGAGCDDIVEGVGLKSIKERAESIGGAVKYLSSKEKGFELNLNLPKVEALISERNL
ncbi:sensor histidine kinase [Clostridium sp. YIM B02515]|uniref:histidine kinase n=1 Tax=Clostridium rhizosphaerae TaxID=2803861 RepID=A0ABS1TAY9_9CLOT|nr:sensor histidine kinase [Clostridium rhizosphaerae]MBL4936519.1 sensor histidine kinase [Clostridium rhizosphaerae]